VTGLHVVVPAGVDDPLHPSGGNTYDREIVAGLAGLGWPVRRHLAAGRWPVPDDAALGALSSLLSRLPDDSLVIVDGLIASASPGPMAAHGLRLRLVVLVHTPLGHSWSLTGRPPRPAGDLEETRTAEEKALSAASALVATSRWTRAWLLRHYGLAGRRIVVAEPGVDPAPAAPGTPAGSRLLCVGAVTPLKGHDVLVDALAPVAGTPWRCVCVGALDLDPRYVAEVRGRARDRGIGARVAFPGPLTGPDLDRAYAEADVLVAPSRVETYGMVVTEALARGIPVIGSDVGGLPEAFGRAPGGSRPGMLVPPGDVPALTRALCRWLDDPRQRRELRSAARSRRTALPGWPRTARRVARLLAELCS